LSGLSYTGSSRMPLAAAPGTTRATVRTRGRYYLLVRRPVHHGPGWRRSTALRACLSSASDTTLQLLQRAAVESHSRLRGSNRLRGTGEVLGLDCVWSLSWRQGCLTHAETVQLQLAPPLVLRSALCGERGWQTDLQGIPRETQPGDDAYDRAALAGACRSGIWAEAALQGVLLAERDGTSVLLRLPGSSVSARLQLCPSATPMRLTLQLHSGGVESWEWPTWPTELLHTDSSGQVARFRAVHLDKTDNALDVELPPASRPAFLAASIPICRCAGGQLALQGCLIGGSAAWWAIDTASDCSIVSTAAADAAGLSSMGLVLQHGVGGAVGGPLRCGVLQLGNLALPETFAQLNLDGALSGMPDGQLPGGAIGLSILRQCSLRLHLPRRVPGSRNPPVNECTLAMVPTLGNDREEASWQAVEWLDGLPHVRATLRMGNAAPPFEGLFRLSLGVGGCGVVLSQTTSAALGFAAAACPLVPSGGLEAGPGESRARLAPIGDGMLSARVGLELRGASFDAVRCLVHAADPADLQLSHRAAGLLAADLFRGIDVLLDLGRNRVAFVQHCAND